MDKINFFKKYSSFIAAIISFVLVLVFTDLFLFVGDYGVLSYCFLTAIIGSVASALLAFAIIIARKNKSDIKTNVIIISASVLIFNIVWIAAYFIPYFGLKWNGKDSSRYVIFFNGAFFLVGYASLIFLQLKNGSRKTAYVLTAIITVCTLAMCVTWISFKPSISGNYLDFNLKIVSNHKFELSNVPKYDGGACSEIYNCGTMTTYDFTKEPTGDETYMQVISRATAKSYNAYKSTLVAQGFTEIFTNNIDGNTFNTYTGKGFLLHLAYYPKSKEVRIIKDVTSVTPNEFSYEAAEVKYKPELFQYAFKEYGGAVEQCGMMYVMRLPDGKLMIIDGGMFTQASDSAVEGFWNFCMDISGTESSQKLPIAAWYCSHGHGDHMTIFHKILAKYEGQYELERVIFNFPSSRSLENSRDFPEDVYTLNRRLLKYAPNAKYLKCHTGQSFNLAGVRIDVLYTHEDLFAPSVGFANLRNFNDSSTVIKLTYDDTSAMILGDLDMKSSKVLLKNFDSALKSDIVQVAHHGFNVVSDLYKKIQPTYAMFPQSEKNAHKNYNCKRTIKVLNKLMPEENIYFARDFTYGFYVNDDKSIGIDKFPFIGEPLYDGSVI